MFGRSSISLEWGRGFDGAGAQAARNSVRQSLKLSTDVLSSMGIPVRGQKIITVHRREKNGLDGATFSERRIELFSSASAARRNKQRVMLYDALTISHEVCHAERMRTYPCKGRLEKVVTEGLAYTGEQRMADVEASLQGVDDRLSKLRRISPRQIEKLGDRLLNGLHKTTEEAQYDAAWLDAKGVSGLSRAEVLGVSLVHRLLDNGAEFRDLLLLPAEEFVEVS